MIFTTFSIILSYLKKIYKRALFKKLFLPASHCPVKEYSYGDQPEL